MELNFAKLADELPGGLPAVNPAKRHPEIIPGKSGSNARFRRFVIQVQGLGASTPGADDDVVFAIHEGAVSWLVVEVNGLVGTSGVAGAKGNEARFADGKAPIVCGSGLAGINQAAFGGPTGALIDAGLVYAEDEGQGKGVQAGDGTARDGHAVESKLHGRLARGGGVGFEMRLSAGRGGSEATAATGPGTDGVAVVEGEQVGGAPGIDQFAPESGARDERGREKHGDEKTSSHYMPSRRGTAQAAQGASRPR